MLSISMILLCIFCESLGGSAFRASDIRTDARYGRYRYLIARVQSYLRCDDGRTRRYSLKVGLISKAYATNEGPYKYDIPMQICTIDKGHSNSVEECDGFSFYNRNISALAFIFQNIERCGCTDFRYCETDDHTYVLGDLESIYGLFSHGEVDFILNWDQKKKAHSMEIYALHRKFNHRSNLKCKFYHNGKVVPQHVKLRADNLQLSPRRIPFREIKKDCNTELCRDIHVFFKLDISACPHKVDNPLFFVTVILAKKVPVPLCNINFGTLNGTYSCSGFFRYDYGDMTGYDNETEKEIDFKRASVVIQFSDLNKCYDPKAKEVNSFTGMVEISFDLKRDEETDVSKSKFNGRIAIDMDWNLKQAIPNTQIYSDAPHLLGVIPKLIMKGKGQPDIIRPINMIKILSAEEMMMHPAPFNTTLEGEYLDKEVLYDDSSFTGTPEPDLLITFPTVNTQPVSTPKIPLNTYLTPKPQPNPYSSPTKPNQQPGIKSTAPVTLEETTRATDAPEINEPETTTEVEEDAVTELHDSEVWEPQVDAQTAGEDAAEDSSCQNHFNIFYLALFFLF